MTPLYGRAEIGKRVIDYVPHGHWKTTTFLAALRHDGLTAPLAIDGAINGKIFFKPFANPSGIFRSRWSLPRWRNVTRLILKTFEHG